MIGLSSASPNPLAVAAPMRSPVKEPGPFATATASISSISKDVLLITSSNIGSNV